MAAKKKSSTTKSNTAKSNTAKKTTAKKPTAKPKPESNELKTKAQKPRKKSAGKKSLQDSAFPGGSLGTNEDSALPGRSLGTRGSVLPGGSLGTRGGSAFPGRSLGTSGGETGRSVVVAREPRAPGAAFVASASTRERPFLVERLLSPDEVTSEYFARRAELDGQFAKARTAVARWLPELKKSEDCKCGHITGVSVRFRSKFGQTVSPLQVVIGVNVARKFRPEDVEAHGVGMLPDSVDGIPIKVVEGQFEFLVPVRAGTLTRSSITSPTRPLSFRDTLVGGVPIAPPGRPNEFGTLGVVASATDGSHLGLTCQHVVQNDFQIEQRGPDVGSLPTTRTIGTVIDRLKSDHIFQGVSETLDCASIELQQPPDDTEQIVFPSTGNWIRGLSHPADQPPSATDSIPIFYSKTRAEMAHSIFPLWKFGSASGQIVKGRIKDVDSSLFVVNGVAFEHNFTVQHFDGNQTFATSGDSGAVLGLEAEVAGKPAFVAIGILFAALQGNSSIGLACNMSHVLDALKPDIPKKLLVDSWDLRQ